VSTELERIVRKLFDDLDQTNYDGIVGRSATDVQAVEEIRRRWMRSRDELKDYFAQFESVMSGAKSELSDIHETSWEDTGLVTFWLEQSYLLDGEEQHVSAPTSMLFRREGGDWKLVLAHSVPVAPEEDDR
jgi:hypothetical protein